MTSLLSLPTETLHLICDFLNGDTYDLALVNKRLCAVAGSHCFHHLKLQVYSRQTLAQQIVRLTETLERRSAFMFVRRLTVWGEMPTLEQEAERIRMPDGAGYSDEQYDGLEKLEEDELTWVPEHYRSYYKDKVSVWNEKECWGPLPEFLSRLTGLTDLIWACRTLFPACLFEVLGTNCRLHCMVFKLPSLHYEHYLDPHRDIDSYEFSLATSPNLTRMVLIDCRLYGPEGIEYNGEALFELLRLAPNLRDLHIIRRVPFGSRFMREIIDRPSAWPGLFIDSHRRPQQYKRLKLSESSGPSQLRTLSLTPARGIAYFLKFQQQIMFSRLETLHLWQVIPDLLLEAAKCQFPSLSALALDPSYHLYRGKLLSEPGDQVTSAFISSISGTLKSIHLSTCTWKAPVTEKAVRAILNTHGHSLEKLSLVGSGMIAREVARLTPDEIRNIAEACPRLEELRIPVCLHRGSANEVNVYKAIGQWLPNLSILWLRLDCLGMEKLQPSSQHLPSAQSLMINIAVDEFLALSIMKTIVNASGLRIQTSKLRYLHLESARDPLVSPELSNIVGKMEFRWKCRRRHLDNEERGTDGIHVERIHGKNPTLGYAKGELGLGEYEDVFRGLWPATSEYWEDDWHSFPLANV